MVQLSVLCARLCKSKQSQYIELIHAIYPKEHDSYAMSGLGKLTQYSLANYDRLTEIGLFLEKRIKADLNSKHFGHVIVGCKIFSELVERCKADIALFRINIENTLKFILNVKVHHVMAKVAAIDTMTKLITVLKENVLSSLLPHVEHVISLLGYVDKDPQSQFKLRIAAVRCIGVIATKMNFFATDKMGLIIHGVLANIYDEGGNFDLKALSTEGQAKSLFDTTIQWKQVDLAENATECLLSLSKISSIDTVSPFLTPIFTFFDDKDLWKTQFPVGVMKLILIYTGWKTHGYVLANQLLGHVEYVKTVSNKISVVQTISMIIDKQNITGTVGSQAMESLSSLMKLLYKSQGEIDFQTALLSAISHIAKRGDHSEQNITLMSYLASFLKKATNEFDIEMLLRAILEIGCYPATVQEGKTFPENTIIKPLLEECINQTRKIEIRILVLKCMARLIRSSQAKKEESSNKFFATFSKKQRDEIHYYLFRAILMEDNTPAMYAEIAYTFLLLLNHYRAKDLEQSLPIAFRLQEKTQSNAIHSVVALYFQYLTFICNNSDLNALVQGVITARLKDEQLSSSWEKITMKEDEIPEESVLIGLFSGLKPVTHLFEREKIVSVLCKMESIKQLYQSDELKEILSLVYSGDLIFKPTVQKEDNPFYDMDEATDDLSRKSDLSLTSDLDLKIASITDVKNVDFTELGQKTWEKRQILNIVRKRLLDNGNGNLKEVDDISSDDDTTTKTEKKQSEEPNYTLSSIAMPQLSLFNMLIS